MTVSSPSPPTKIKYITNKELLAEIHKSKVTFCYYTDPAYTHYDAIVQSTNDITDELIAKVRAKKANPRGKPSVDIETIPVDSLVFRVMTYEHIPLDPHRVRKSRVTDQSYAKTSFFPFKHYVRKEEGLVEVLRSHWKGGFDNGHFEADGGRISNRLAHMVMLLVDRYSRRGNWRGYTYVDEMRSQALLQLSQVALQFEESKSETPNPFAFYTQIIRNCFTRVLLAEKKVQSIRDDMLIIQGALPSYTRQIDNELEYRFPSQPKPGPGRKKATAVPPPTTPDV